MNTEQAIAIYNAVATFVAANPIVIALAIYAALNVCKRLPPPTNPLLARAWAVFESAMVLGWERWGGPLKTLPDAALWQQSEAATKPETPLAKQLDEDEVLRKLLAIQRRKP